MDVVDVAPAAAVDGLHESVLADVGEDAVPVERILEVAHGAVGGALGMLLVGQDHGGRHGHAELGGERVVEELVVGRPPERIVDDDGAVERGVLEKGAVEGNVVRDAVDDDGVGRRLVEMDGAGFDELGVDASMLRALMCSTSAPGKLFSMPNRTPIFFMPYPPETFAATAPPSPRTCVQCKTALRAVAASRIRLGSETFSPVWPDPIFSQEGTPGISDARRE